MGEAIALPCGADATLLIEERPGVAWYGCTLLVSDQESYLGAESRAYLVAHLLEVPKDPGPVTGVMAGEPVRWVLSLSERHCSLYVHDGPEGEKTLFWQDGNGRIIHRGCLDVAALAVWQRVLAGEA
jgi:hypothetical protein